MKAFEFGDVGTVHHAVCCDVGVDDGSDAARLDLLSEFDCWKSGGLGPAFDRNETVLRVDTDGDTVGAEALDEGIDEVDGFGGASANNNALDAGVESVLDGLFGAHPSAHLNGDGEGAGDLADGIEIFVGAGESGVEIDDVQPVAAF